MPVLHQYSKSADYYAKSHIKGAIVTFQLTQDGQRKLLDSGLAESSKFPLNLLLDLVRSGDAYTGGSGVEMSESIDAGQLTFDFPEDEAAEKLLPSCSVTGSYDDLHLVVLQRGEAPVAQLLSPVPRRQIQEPILLSIPLPLLDLKALNHLQRMDKLPDDATISSLRHWFNQDMTAYWERWRRQRTAKPQQFGLLAPDEEEPSLFTN